MYSNTTYTHSCILSCFSHNTCIDWSTAGKLDSQAEKSNTGPSVLLHNKLQWLQKFDWIDIAMYWLIIVKEKYLQLQIFHFAYKFRNIVVHFRLMTGYPFWRHGGKGLRTINWLGRAPTFI